MSSIAINGVPPPIQWAQRNTTVLLTLAIPDPADVQLRITAIDPAATTTSVDGGDAATAAAAAGASTDGDAQFFSFQCVSRPPAVTAGTSNGGAAPVEEKRYTCNLKLFAPVIAEESLQTVRARGIQLVLKKKTADEFWPRLFFDKKKFPNVQIDWGKWKTEDELEEAGGTLDDGAADLDDPRGIAELHSTLSILRQNQTAALAERQLVRRNQRKAEKEKRRAAAGPGGDEATMDVSSGDDEDEEEVGPDAAAGASGDMDLSSIARANKEQDDRVAAAASSGGQAVSIAKKAPATGSSWLGADVAPTMVTGTPTGPDGEDDDLPPLV
jgi:hypothetical protein